MVVTKKLVNSISRAEQFIDIMNETKIQVTLTKNQLINLICGYSLLDKFQKSDPIQTFLFSLLGEEISDEDNLFRDTRWEWDVHFLLGLDDEKLLQLYYSLTTH